MSPEEVIDKFVSFELMIKDSKHICWGYASSPKILQEETPLADPLKSSVEAIIHKASA
jgi:hypothetical protein